MSRAMKRMRGIAAAAAAALVLSGCGAGGPTAGDRTACETYTRAHATFQSQVAEISDVTARGEKVSRELADVFFAARGAAYESIGEALAVAEDPDLVIALRRADSMKAGLVSKDGDAAAAYLITRHGVETRCTELGVNE